MAQKVVWENFKKVVVFLDIRATRRGRGFVYSYRKLNNLCNVKRAGFYISGCYGKAEQAEYDASLEGRFFKNRGQSDQEHCDGCKNVVNLLMMHYPEVFDHFFTPQEKKRYNGEDNMYLLLSTLVTWHEVGEGNSGDIPSDGTRDEKAKDKEELAEVDDILTKSNCSAHWKEVVTRMFKEMQDKSSAVGILGFSVDKFDAVYYNLELEASGRTGWANIKTKVTDQDQAAFRITGDWRNADIWLCNAFINNPKLVLGEHTRIFLEITLSFAEEVRGQRDQNGNFVRDAEGQVLDKDTGAVVMGWLPGFINDLEKEQKNKQESSSRRRNAKKNTRT